jgi:hypothetical protein
MTRGEERQLTRLTGWEIKALLRRLRSRPYTEDFEKGRRRITMSKGRQTFTMEKWRCAAGRQVDLNAYF